MERGGNKGSGNCIPTFPCAVFPYPCCVKLWSLHLLVWGFFLSHISLFFNWLSHFPWLIIPFPCYAEEETPLISWAACAVNQITITH